MLREKEVVILDIEEDKSFELVRFMDENLVAKTPTFSLDGKKLYFSATEGMEPGVGNDNEFENWFAQYHNIYEYDLESAEVRKLTEETSFDILPINLGETVLYFRSQDNELDKFSLLKLNNELKGIDDMLIEDIVFKDKFYGNIHPATSMDILLHSKKF